ADGSTTARVAFELRSRVPEGVADLPDYVLGSGVTGLPDGTIRTRVTVYAPVGGHFGPLTLDGAAFGGVPGQERGRAVILLTSDLAPGEEQRYEVEVTLPTSRGAGVGSAITGTGEGDSSEPPADDRRPGEIAR